SDLRPLSLSLSLLLHPRRALGGPRSAQAAARQTVSAPEHHLRAGSPPMDIAKVPALSALRARAMVARPPSRTGVPHMKSPVPPTVLALLAIFAGTAAPAQPTQPAPAP